MHNFKLKCSGIAPRYTRPADLDFIIGKPLLDEETQEIAAAIGLSQNDVWDLIEMLGPVRCERRLKWEEALDLCSSFSKNRRPYGTRQKIRTSDILEYIDSEKRLLVHVVSPPPKCDSPGIEPTCCASKFHEETGWRSSFVSPYELTRIVKVASHWERFSESKQPQLYAEARILETKGAPNV